MHIMSLHGDLRGLAIAMVIAGVMIATIGTSDQSWLVANQDSRTKLPRRPLVLHSSQDSAPILG